jgi:hypothetical protein
MREESLSLLVAVSVMVLALAGCDQPPVQAKMHSSTVNTVNTDPAPAEPETTSVKAPQLLVRAIAPSEALQAQPSAAFGGLQARVQQATDQAAAGGATLSVAILDRATHQLVTNGNTQIVGTASVSKLFIADDLLLQESQGRTLSPDDRQALDAMLEASDDGAAEKFWGQDGAGGIVTQIANRYGLTSTTPPSDGRWWNTMSSATDLIHYYDMLLDGSGGLPSDRARIIVNDLSQSTPNGADGYPQRFGIPDGLYDEPVAVKQGWMCCIGSDWMHLSTGVIGSDRRYVMVIQSLQPSDDATARDTITHAVKAIFPGGRI